MMEYKEQYTYEEVKKIKDGAFMNGIALTMICLLATIVFAGLKYPC